MSLVGRGLDSLIKEQPGQHFSPGTAIGISIQLLNALRALHTIGYLHRDIKPANSTMGRAEENELRLLYLLDFGMARQFMHADVRINFARKINNFVTTGNSETSAKYVQLPWISALCFDIRTYWT